MSHFLQLLIGADEPLFSNGIAQLEKSTGNCGIDIRLIADLTENSHRIMRKLGLDVKDTTGPELYAALLSTVKLNTAEDLLVDYDYVMIALDKKVISFNLIDVIENAHHHIPFDKQIINHGQRSLCGELVKRYIDHPRTNEHTTKHIAKSIGLIS